MDDGVQLEVVEDAADEERLEDLALLLRQELLMLDVRSVEPYTEDAAPDGSRGALAAVAGVLSVSLAPGLQALGSVIVVIREWLRRGGSNRTVKLTVDGDVIELTGATGEMQQQLVDAFVRRHSGVDA
ncbi:hypothetical protein EV651_11680 [Kribbella sp. VKM Ac-2571]|uniref:hypothetical protein n=1 Tax=Kribbella sp. VKM Ac-2571 TaxID=2512222 RepID=UPI00105B9AD8|nr:hypothetical protein [Kribbella sp. VKM Ac-2571]TDO54076.1 hypothetical protein EV651_11680 [Kribbella sp. VKM Ac-2571]